MKALSAPAVAAAVALAGCGGGDPFQSQLRADIRQAKRDSPYGFRQGFVSRWDNGGEPAFASCILMGFDPETKASRAVKIYPHGGGVVRVGLGAAYAEAEEWREYCTHPIAGAARGRGAPVRPE